YDHNYVLNSGGRKLALAARAYEPKSGRVMENYTTEPGVQLYTANFIGDTKGKGRAAYNKQGGFCLVTQHFPAAISQPSSPSVVVRPGKAYETTTVYKFSTK